MKRLMKRRKTDNRGLTLVELICAMAILSIIGTIVGGILVVSAQSYDTGINEAELQQEAQMVVNQINDLVIDTTATESVTFAGDTLTIPEGIKTHKVRYDAAQQKLFYSCDASGEELMASGITSFIVDTTSFQNTGNLYVDIGLERMSNGQPRSFDATFQITSRNGVVDTTPTASIDVVDDIILEPHQSYPFDTRVVGITDQNVTWSIVGGNTDSSTTMIGNKITIGGGEKGSIIHLLVSTVAKDADGNPMATRAVRVRIRRVNEITAKIVEQVGESFKNGTVYTIEADLSGTYLDKELRDWDNNYVSPYKVTWSSSVAGGATQPDILPLVGNPDNPSLFYAKVTLKADMPRNSKITIRVTASHPNGENKSTLTYGNVYAECDLDNSQYLVPAHGMGRGSDDKLADFYYSDLVSLLVSKFGNDTYNCKRTYRFRENGSGDSGWSPWYTSKDFSFDGDNSTTINLRPAFGLMMKYDRGYDVQVKLEMVKQSTGAVVWPFADTPVDQYLIEGSVNRVQATFKSTALGFNNAYGISQEKAKKVSKYYNDVLFETDDLLSLGGESTRESFKDDFYFILQRKEGSDWVEVSTRGPERTCRVQLNGVAGEYRVLVYMYEDLYYDDNGVIKHIDLKNMSESEKAKYRYDIWKQGAGEGIFYFIAE